MADTKQHVERAPHVSGLTEAEAAERAARGLNNAAAAAPSRSYKRIVFQNAVGRPSSEIGCYQPI